MTAPHYECLIVGRTPHETNEPALELVDRITPLKNIAWEDRLVGDGMGSVAVSAVGLTPAVGRKFLNLSKTPCELWILRNGVTVHAGPILGLQTQGESITIVSRGALYYLKYMYLQRNYEQTISPFLHVKNFVEQWYRKPDGTADQYAKFGIKTSHIGTSELPVPTWSNGNHITVRVYHEAEELHNVREVIDKISTAAKRGFDFYIDHSTFTSDNGVGQFGPNASRKLMLVNRPGPPDPADPEARRGRGEDRSSEVALELRNLKDVRMWASVAVDDVASWFRTLGTDPKKKSQLVLRENASLKETFGKAGSKATVDGSSIDSSVEDYTETALDVRSDYFLKVGGNTETASAYSMVGADAMSFGPGDIITFAWDSGYGWIEEKRTVFSKIVKIDPTGTELYTVEFL